MEKTIRHYLTEQEDKMMEELFTLLRIPSISAKLEYAPDMEKCAHRWQEILLGSGTDTATILQTTGNPVVYAEKIIDASLPTVLVYAHYDVMPAEPLDKWISPPFEPKIREGHIWGRGADDDKGQAFIQVKAFEYLVKNNLLTVNVKFLFEGEEEIGSPSLEAFCRANKELLKADVILGIRYQYAES